MNTSNNPLITCIIATYNRKDDLEEVIDSILQQKYEEIEIIIISSSTDDTAEFFEKGGKFDRDGIKYFEYDERMGVPEARNLGFEHASGDIYISIDDDAVLVNDDAMERVVSIFTNHPDVGAISFQAIDYDTREVNWHETPDPPEFDLTPKQTYRATNFVGVGHAIKKEVIEKAGMYPSDFVYGFEEIDISFRIHDSGYDIMYTPNIVVAHKKSPEGRMTTSEIQKRLVENRIKLAVRNLPWRYVFFTAAIWSCYCMVLTRNWKTLITMLEEVRDSTDELLESRKKVSRKTIRRLKQRNALLYAWWLGPHPRRILDNLERLKWEL